MFFTAILTDMPTAVLAAIVFLIGISLIDVAGLKKIYRRRPSEFWIAAITGTVVFAVGVEQGIILAIVLSILEIIRRQYRPQDFVVGVSTDGVQSYVSAEPGHQSAPGLIVFRYDAELFYANVNQFVDDVQGLVEHAPDPVRWVVLDAGSIDDVDYSAGVALAGLLDYLQARQITFAVARADTGLLHTLEHYGLRKRIPDNRHFASLSDAVAAFRAEPPFAVPQARTGTQGEPVAD